MKAAFGALVNDKQRLDMVLRQSEFPKDTICHVIKMPESATKGLNKLLDMIEGEGHDVAILVHQEPYRLLDSQSAVLVMFALRECTMYTEPLMTISPTVCHAIQTSTAQRGNVISVARRACREPPRTVCTPVTPLKVPRRARVRM